MSLAIESVEELQGLLKKLRLTVANVEELKGLLTTINAGYNPEAARIRAARQIGVSVPSVALSAAGVISFFVVVLGLGPNTSWRPEFALGALGIVWGVAGVVSLLAAVGSLILLGVRRPSLAARGVSPPGEPALAAPTERSPHVMIPREFS